MLQVERFFRQCQILLRHCCRFWQQRCRFRQQCRTKFRPFNKVERNWIIIITCSICFDFVERNERTKFYNRIVRHCCRLWQQSRMLLLPSRTLLRHCCLLWRCLDIVAGVDGVLHSRRRRRASQLPAQSLGIPCQQPFDLSRWLLQRLPGNDLKA